MTSRRWMALFFALGSTCFLVGPFPGYVQLVGDTADAVTFFAGSILFTLGERSRAGSPGSNAARPTAGAPRGGRRSSSPPERSSST
jgi:hypothetical protein